MSKRPEKFMLPTYLYALDQLDGHLLFKTLDGLVERRLMQIGRHLQRPRPRAHVPGILDMAIYQALIMLKRACPLGFIFTDGLIQNPLSGLFDENQALAREPVDANRDFLDLDPRQLLLEFRLAEDLAGLGLDFFVDGLFHRREGHGGQMGAAGCARGKGQEGEEEEGDRLIEGGKEGRIVFVFASAAIVGARIISQSGQVPTPKGFPRFSSSPSSINTSYPPCVAEPVYPASSATHPPPHRTTASPPR